MRNIEIYINSQIADFQDVSELPLSWTKSTDKFLEIVGASGIELEQAFRSMSFPATQNNSRIFQANQNQSVTQIGSTVFKMTVFVNGLQVFNGQVSLKNTIRKSGKIHSFVVEAVGDGNSLWQKLDGVTLNQLDLGQIMWDFDTIRDSWDKTIDDMNGIFAPVVYGAVSSVVGTGAFTAADFRFSVYDIAILKAIFEKVGYTIESNFFNSTMMRESVYLYGNGSKMIRGGNLSNLSVYVKADAPHNYSAGTFTFNFVTEVTDPSNQFSSNVFTAASLGEYTFEFTVYPQMKTKVTFSIYNGVTTKTVDYQVNGSSRVVVKHIEPLKAGQTVTILAENLEWGNGAPSVIFSMALSVTVSSKPIVGNTIDVASCLHNKPVKDYLRGITHRVCGAWFVNETIKKVYFEPRFDYTEDIDGTKTVYAGFYASAANEPLEMVSDIQSIETDFNLPFGSKLTLAYAEDSNDPLETTYKKGGSLAPYSAYIAFNDRGGKENSSRNPYFTTLYTSAPNGIRIYSGVLPTVLPSDYKVGEALPGTIIASGIDVIVAGTKTFESNPKCALIIREGVNINIEDENGVVYANQPAPFLTQQYATINDPNYGFCLSYSDVTRPSDNQTTRGLTSNFYTKYFSIIRQGIQVKLYGEVRLTDLVSLDFRRLIYTDFDNNPSLWILLMIDDYKIASDRIAQMRLMKHCEPTEDDASKSTFFDPKIDIVTPDIK